MAATAASPSGKQIYQEHCVRCHGSNGEGVKGKYDDALHGDWSVERLSRYISRTMPEDDPEAVRGADAEAAARFIHETFYSREARARIHSARVELARLTNRQYVNTVADLLKSFGAAESKEAGERGLAATYRLGGRRRADERKSIEKVDPRVSFVFGTNVAELGSIETNSFTAEWRGSVFAGENGEYEFIVKTPNGARLWVNDDETPLIDASVASGSMEEHRAALKLIGGRRYPLRLELSKSQQQKTASMTLEWRPPHGAPEIVPARVLSTIRVPPTYVVTTPFPPDDSSVGYERGVSISKAWDDATTQAAISVANHVLKHLDRLAKTKEGETNRAAKLQAFSERFVTTAFRRSLSTEETNAYVARHFSSAPKPEEAVKRVVILALKSPHFLYLGLEKQPADGYDIATRLSFALWDSLPDAELLTCAASGALLNQSVLRQQAERMLSDVRTRSKVQYFLQHWLQMNHVEDLSKDSQLFPDFTPEIIGDLRTSLRVFLDDVVWSEASDYRKLLLADHMFVNERLAVFYGFKRDDSVLPGDFVKVTADPVQRCGVLTHPYLLAAFSYQKSSSPIHRGVFLTRNVVGRALKAPPIAVAFNEAEFKPEMSMREKVAQLTRSEACQTCHSVINPLGFSLEHFDAVGRFRTKENGRAIDAVSEYVTDDGSTVRLAGPRDVANFAVNSIHAQGSFIEQLFHQIVKQPMLAYGSDVEERLRTAFVRNDFNIRKLVVNIAVLAASRGVQGPPMEQKPAKETKRANTTREG